MDALFCGDLAFVLNSRKAPIRITHKKTHEVEHMGAKHYEVIAPSPLILLPAATDFENRPDFSSVYQLPDAGRPMGITGLMGYGTMDMIFVTSVDHGVRLVKRRTDRFLQKDVGLRVGSGNHHGGVLIKPPVANRDDVRLFPFEHLSKIGIGFVAMETPGRGGTPLAIFVCDRDNFGSIGKIEPNGINAVAVVPLARSTDDGDPVGFFHR
jgi:hypothetical protein